MIWDQNHELIERLIRNLSQILWNITTVVGIRCKGYSRECIIYSQLVGINCYICTDFFCCRGERFKY